MTETVKYPSVMDTDGVYLALCGTGVDEPCIWQFKRVYPISNPEAEKTIDVKGNTKSVFLNKEMVSSSINLTTWDYIKNINDACERLIDHALIVLEKGEELRVILREEKEKFLKWFEKISQDKLLVNIDSMLIPEGARYSLIDHHYTGEDSEDDRSI